MTQNPPPRRRKRAQPSKDPAPLDRLLADPSALRWLEKHPEFGSVDMYKGGTIAFPTWTSPDGALFVQQLEEVYDSLSRRHKRIARAFLRYTPAQLSKRRKLPVKVIYRQYESLRETVRKTWQEQREAQLGYRGNVAALDTLPEYVAVASRTLEHDGQRVHVYKVPAGIRLIWVDAQGRALPDDVQELLDNLHEHAADFQYLDAE